MPTRVGDVPPELAAKFKKKPPKRVADVPSALATPTATPALPVVTAPGEPPEHLPPVERPAPTWQSVHVGPVTIGPNPADITQPVLTSDEEEQQNAERAYEDALSQHKYYKAYIEPRLNDLDGGMEGFYYALPGFAKHAMDADPAVQHWIAMMGPLANKMNLAYAGKRASALGFSKQTRTHVPAPPDRGWKGAWGSLGEIDLEQWDNWLLDGMYGVGVISGRIKPKTPVQMPADAFKLEGPGNKYWSPSQQRSYDVSPWGGQ